LHELNPRANAQTIIPSSLILFIFIIFVDSILIVLFDIYLIRESFPNNFSKSDFADR